MFPDLEMKKQRWFYQEFTVCFFFSKDSANARRTAEPLCQRVNLVVGCAVRVRRVNAALKEQQQSKGTINYSQPTSVTIVNPTIETKIQASAPR